MSAPVHLWASCSVNKSSYKQQPSSFPSDSVIFCKCLVWVKHLDLLSKINCHIKEPFSSSRSPISYMMDLLAGMRGKQLKITFLTHQWWRAQSDTINLVKQNNNNCTWYGSNEMMTTQHYQLSITMICMYLQTSIQVAAKEKLQCHTCTDIHPEKNRQRKYTGSR